MYKYLITATAQREIESIFAYIAEELIAPDSAVALIDDMTEAMRKACQFPLSHVLVNDGVLRNRGYRRIQVKNYLLLYSVDEERECLYFVHVVYCARDYLRNL